jgi:4-amino-4-deoxy-L-arabinose transferase-like glycosyltransferase
MALILSTWLERKKSNLDRSFKKLMEEPSVLDYVKSWLMPWKGQRIRIPSEGAEVESEAGVALATDELTTEPAVQMAVAQPGISSQSTEIATPTPIQAEPAAKALAYRLPWRSLLALALALLAQTGMEPPNRNAPLGLAFYIMAGVVLVWAILQKEWVVPELPEDTPIPMSFKVNWAILGIGFLIGIAAFLTYTNDRFTLTNLTLGVVALGYVVLGFYLPNRKAGELPFWKRPLDGITKFIRSRPAMTWGMVILIVVLLGLTLFYRFYRLSGVPGEMFSDHAEKLLDVTDVLDGKTSIFFQRNTGREAIQFYLTAAIIQLLGTGISFISLKLGTALLGVLTLPYIYLLGREVGGKWVGVIALTMAAIGYWPNVISRVGLRFPLYPVFLAPALYYLIRGLRYQHRNDFIWSGIALGLGLNGYTPYRIVPFVLVILVLLYLAHRQAQGKRQSALVGLVIIAVVSLILFLPLLRFALESPVNMQYFDMRALSRLGSSEQSLPGPALQIFFSNLWKAWIMPFWDNGQIWVHSIPGRPALDVVSAALYFLGTAVVLIRYLRQRHWIDLFLLISVPLLMMPSILSLAFPDENPSLNRTGAAYVPVFILAAIGLESALKALKGRSASRWGMAMVVVVTGVLFAGSATQNYDLVFNQYSEEFLRGAWNTSQIGAVIHEFATTIGTPDTAYVIGYPYWVDTRLVGINAGYPRKDYALAQDALPATTQVAGAKLFIFKPEDLKTLDMLRNLYPKGSASVVKGPYEGKDFVEYTVLQ